ncbi:hypothetical protein Amet_3425 [Alkaliphilus metalliredigens QYMF]|uniref:ATP-grasp domain-containing protein n=2 Tax=Alkaliphilus TaxID=114627 RepID=A6TTN5_ALKMQ|nr:hypothetical protein Amet_3425 [Alkaliphilus metalliredigens QYMF]
MKLLWLKSLKPNEMALNISLFKKLKQPKIIILHFGMLIMKFKVIIKNNLSDDTIGLPKNFSNKYTIPTNIPYDVYCKAGEIYLGPVIAFVSRGGFKQLKKQKYIRSLPSFLDYNSIKGLIIICTKGSIDVDSGMIKGYYFDPRATDSELEWKYGEFPLPNAILNHSLMSQEKISALRKKMGDKVFNSYWLNLDKWETWEFLSNNPMLKDHLPYTEKFLGFKQLNYLLEKYSSIYLKPAKRARGIGLMKLDKDNTGISLVDYKKKKYYFNDNQSLALFLNNKLAIPYIIQQAVYFKKNDRHVDFRLILQKNSKKEWSLTGLIARIAQEGSIITNKKGREKSILGRKALTSIFKVSEERAKKIEVDMTQVVIETVKMYERKGYHLGDVAADIAVDSNLKVWLLELQLNYGVNARTIEGLRDFFEKVISVPFKYAKALAGFEK